MADEEHEARECMACRGTGQVISNLGGTPHSVSCPWCEGRGLRIPGLDAQARWLAERADGEGDGSGQDTVPAAAAGGQASGAQTSQAGDGMDSDEPPEPPAAA